MRRRLSLLAIALLGTGLGARATAAEPDAQPAPPASAAPVTQAELPYWARAHRMTVLLDSVLLSGFPTIRKAFPDYRVAKRGRPALMIRIAERELRQSGNRVSPVVVVGIGYNSLWERGRRNYGMWSRRFDREATRLMTTLRARGAKQIVWVTLREPTVADVGPRLAGELDRYSWYFGYVNERLRRLDRTNDDLVLADWEAVSHQRGLTYDTIHLTDRGATLMAKTIEDTVRGEARRQAAARKAAAGG